MALNIYNELRNSLRHIENSIIVLLTIFTSLLTLFKMLEIKLELAMIFISLLWLYAGIGSYYYYSRKEKLLRRLTNIIIEDPMDKEDMEILKDTFYWLLLIIGVFILQLLIIFS